MSSGCYFWSLTCVRVDIRPWERGAARHDHVERAVRPWVTTQASESDGHLIESVVEADANHAVALIEGAGEAARIR